jgi:hypothetical protein
MGAIGGLLGTSGGASGTGYSKPATANILQPTTVDQANAQYQNAQSALGQQQAFLQATQAQNGLQNQQNVFGQLQGVAAGQGPNPAQAQLAQATGANVANQAALMAGQRGAGQNAGLIARQAAQQGAQTQQQAAGQGATLQAQQSLNALQGLGGLATQQVGQQGNALNAATQATQNEQSQILGGIAAQNNANVGMQSNVNSTNASLANQQMQGQQGLLGGVLGGLSALAEGGKVHAANGVYAQVPDMSDDQWNAMSANPNGTPPPAPSQASQQSPSSNSSTQATPVQQSQQNQSQANYGNPGANALAQGMQSLISGKTPNNSGYKGKSSFGTFLSNIFSGSSTSTPTTTGTAAPWDIGGGTAGGPQDTTNNSAPASPGSDTGGDSSDVLAAAEGGKVPAMVSPGEVYLPPSQVKEVVKKGKDPIESGEKIPGKPKVAGAKNDYANDTVPKTLEEGGIVLPRSVTQAKHPQWAAHKFISATMAKNKGRLK